MMDRPAIHAAEDFVHAGYPLDVEALLIVELDGPARPRSTYLIDRVEAIAKANNGAVTDPRVAATSEERSVSASGPAARRRSRPSDGFQPGLLLHGRHHSAPPETTGSC